VRRSSPSSTPSASAWSDVLDGLGALVETGLAHPGDDPARPGVDLFDTGGLGDVRRNPGVGELDQALTVEHLPGPDDDRSPHAEQLGDVGRGLGAAHRHLGPGRPAAAARLALVCAVRAVRLAVLGAVPAARVPDDAAVCADGVLCHVRDPFRWGGQWVGPSGQE
jgi:hypothetical protein